jgi:hypothetical protein
MSTTTHIHKDITASIDFSNGVTSEIPPNVGMTIIVEGFK